jgi:hypothetical protein
VFAVPGAGEGGLPAHDGFRRTDVGDSEADQALAVPAAKVEQFLGVPLVAQISDDNFEVTRAVEAASSVVGSPKGKKSKLAREYRMFAKSLLQTSLHRSEEQVQVAATQELLAAV